MAVIYSYPVKTNPVDADLVLISDSADSNNTKQVKVSSIRGATVSGVADVNISAVTSTLSSGAPLVSLPNSGNVIITSRAYAGAANVGHVPTGGSATTFLRGDGSWIVPTNTTYDVMGSGNSYAAGLVLAGNVTHNNNFLRKDGTWAVPVDTGISFSGSTANGLVAYSNSTTAAVSSNFTLTASQLRFPAGAVSAPSLNFTDVGGIYSASGGYFLTHTGSNSIGFTSATTINYKITRFDAGLKFGSTGETLNSYEEGTWTPSPYVPAGSAPTASVAVGSFTKIGDLVNCYFYLNITSASSANVPMIISGLPFSASNTNGYRGMVSISRNDGTNFIQQQPISGLVSGNQATLKRPDIQASNPSGTTVSITNTETINASWYATASLNYILEGTIIFKV